MAHPTKQRADTTVPRRDDRPLRSAGQAVPVGGAVPADTTGRRPKSDATVPRERRSATPVSVSTPPSRTPTVPRSGAKSRNPVAAALPPAPAVNRRPQLAYHGPPSGSTGHPNGANWGDDWSGPGSVTVDFDRFNECVLADGRETDVYLAAARARPDDRSLTKPRLNVRPLSDPPNSKTWSKDACTYCLFRPTTPNASQPWLAGTKDGEHNPYRCDSFKRYLAEGGESTNTPREKSFLQSCLHYRAPYRGSGK
jgi:hypothetical protein